MAPGKARGNGCESRYIHPTLQQNVNHGNAYAQPNPGGFCGSNVMFQWAQFTALRPKEKDPYKQEQYGQYLTPVSFAGFLEMVKKPGTHKANSNLFNPQQTGYYIDPFNQKFKNQQGSLTGMKSLFNKNPGNKFRDSIDALKFVDMTNVCNPFSFWSSDEWKIWLIDNFIIIS